MITRRLVWALGMSQLVLWGISYYLVAVFAEPIARDTGWPPVLVYGGFSAALLVMGLSSGAVGRLIDRHGGRPVMTVGALLTATGCAGLALSTNLVVYFLSWVVLGAAMRMTLYDAAFASLARIGGPAARRPISQITLLGGLASTVLWPVGEALIAALGWRGAMGCYAAIAVAIAPVHLLIPDGRFDQGTGSGRPPLPPLARNSAERIQAGLLFAGGVTLATVLNSAMSAHMIGILGGLGMSSALAVWISTLRGVGQSAARLCEVLFGGRVDPIGLGLLAAAVIPIGFLVSLGASHSLLAGILFALLYGAGNGLATIVRGTQPLVLFDPASYGQLVGRLIGPSFYLSALAPLAFAAVIERYGEKAALWVCVGLASLALGCALTLWLSFGRRRTVGLA